MEGGREREKKREKEVCSSSSFLVLQCLLDAYDNIHTHDKLPAFAQEYSLHDLFSPVPICRCFFFIQKKKYHNVRGTDIERGEKGKCAPERERG